MVLAITASISVLLLEIGIALLVYALFFIERKKPMKQKDIIAELIFWLAVAIFTGILADSIISLV